MTVEQAIRLIQIHERARQGRLRARFMQDIRVQDEREKRRKANPVASITQDDAAILIQSQMRKYLAKYVMKGPFWEVANHHPSSRKRVVEMRKKEWSVLGMGPMPGSDGSTAAKGKDPISKAIKSSEQRRIIQDQYEQQYQQALVNIKQKLTDIEGPDMKENMSDKIRKWFITCRDQVGPG